MNGKYHILLGFQNQLLLNMVEIVQFPRITSSVGAFMHDQVNINGLFCRDRPCAGNLCSAGNSKILFAWARNAPPTHLPDGKLQFCHVVLFDNFFFSYLYIHYFHLFYIFMLQFLLLL